MKPVPASWMAVAMIVMWVLMACGGGTGVRDTTATTGAGCVHVRLVCG